MKKRLTQIGEDLYVSLNIYEISMSMYNVSA